MRLPRKQPDRPQAAKNHTSSLIWQKPDANPVEKSTIDTVLT